MYTPTAGSIALRFGSPPGILPSYFRVLTARKGNLVPDGETVPRIEATLHGVSVPKKKIAKYNEVCGYALSDELPVTYPHVVAMPVHLAMLTTRAFPIQLMGIVHVNNRIEQQRPWRIGERADVHAWLEGHRETPRGQEFELHTELLVGDEVIWSEVCTLLARRRIRTRPQAPAQGKAVAPDGQKRPIAAPSNIGRRYAWASGDFNPIHLTRMAARPFGFPRAIAHGMWSLARCLSELPARDGRQTIDVVFHTPVFLPASLLMHFSNSGPGMEFALCDARTERVHLSGTVST